MLEVELHALKKELQCTLAHLGIVCVSSKDDVNMHERIDTTSIAATIEKNSEKQRNRRSLRRRHQCSDRNRPITQWNRRQLTKELALVSARHKELKMQLQIEIEREHDDQDEDKQQQRQEQLRNRKSVWQGAIRELQQQRARILQQMEQETSADEAERGDEREETRQSGLQKTQESEQRQIPSTTITRPFTVTRNENETQYSINGVVTLEPLSLSQQPQVPTMKSEAPLHRPVGVSSVVANQARDTSSILHYRSTPDAMHDVFSLQLKFAETMSKLEKSVQIRDQLLRYDRTSSLPKRKTRTQLIKKTQQNHGRNRHRNRSIESETSSDISVAYQEKCSDESFSPSSYSFSSLDSTPHHEPILREGHPADRASKATATETLAPSTSEGLNRESLAAEEAIGRMCTTISANVIAQSLHEPPENNQNGDGEHTPSNAQTLEARRTPTTESSGTTPTTGSDQKSISSLSKQVHFGDDAYSTPVLARKFNFDGPSIDEDEFEEKDEEAESVLSFLGGSSVTSAELNDVSFVRAFDRFRRELNAYRINSAPQSTSQLPLARRLFTEQDVSKTAKTTNVTPRTMESTGKADACENSSAFSSLDSFSVEELQMRRRQLCLDIQSESAQLALNFCGAEHGTAGKTDTKHTQNRLQKMRHELKAVNDRLGIT